MATVTTTKPLTGRRKEAVARVRLLPGTGNVTVNDRTIADYLKRESLVQDRAAPARRSPTLDRQVRRRRARDGWRAHRPGGRDPHGHRACAAAARRDAQGTCSAAKASSRATRA